MSRLTQPGQGSPIEVFETNSNPGGTYNYVDLALDTLTGMKFMSSDGRWFSLVQNGATALGAGKLVATPANTAAHIGLAVSAFTAYSANGNQPAQVTCTLASTGVTPNEYAGGYMQVETGTGAGQYLRIASHPGATGAGALVVTLANPEGKNMTALVAASSTVSLFRPKYGSKNGGVAATFSTTGYNFSTNGVVVCPTTTVATIVGLSNYIIPASTASFASYGLIQTWGTATALNHGGSTIGKDLENSTQSTPIAGAVETYAVANGVRIGYATQTGTDTQYSEIFLQIG